MCKCDSEATKRFIACLVQQIDNNLKTINLVELHKGTNASEAKRVEEAGVYIFWGRVKGSLAVIRAFGDMMFKTPKTNKDLVIVDPYISEHILDATCKYIILACDGLWDVCTHNDAALFVDNCVKENKTAKLLTEHAFREGSRDNITVQIVKLDFI